MRKLKNACRIMWENLKCRGHFTNATIGDGIILKWSLMEDCVTV